MLWTSLVWCTFTTTATSWSCPQCDPLPRLFQVRQGHSFAFWGQDVRTFSDWWITALAGRLGSPKRFVQFLWHRTPYWQVLCIFNLVNDTVVFMNLGGAKAKSLRIGGHMTLNILDFQHHNPKSWQAWSEFEHDNLWQDPHPEFILSDQVPPVDINSLRSEFADDPISSVLVGSMASHLPAHQEGSVPDPQGHDDDHQPRIVSKGGVASTSTSRGVESSPGQLSAHIVQEVRERPRPLRNVQPLRKQLEVESRPSEVGSSGSSWIKRSLYSLAAFATTFLGNDFNTPGNISEGQGGLQFSPIRSAGSSKDSPLHEDYDTTIWRHGEWPVDRLLEDELHAGPLVGGALPGGLQHHGADATFHREARTFAEHAFFNEEVYKEDRIRLQKADNDRRWERMVELGVISAEGRPNLRLGGSGTRSMRPGVAKRLRGLWKRSADYLNAENEVYLGTTSTSSRPPPTADLWELFAGRALCSQLAHEYDLVAIQPFDLIYGQDFKKYKARAAAVKTLDTMRPLLLMIEIDCLHYTIFNRNLNYSQRPLEWQQLQNEDCPLLVFSVDMAERQIRAGRFFFVENPERSELWSQPEMKKLAQKPGVFSFVMDAGCFGAQINGERIAKPFRILTNFTGLDEVLQHRLTVEEKTKLHPNSRCPDQEVPRVPGDDVPKHFASSTWVRQSFATNPVATSMRCCQCRSQPKIFHSGMRWSRKSASPSRTLPDGHTTLWSAQRWEAKSKTFFVWMQPKFRRSWLQQLVGFPLTWRTSALEQLFYSSMTSPVLSRWKTWRSSDSQSRGLPSQSGLQSSPMVFVESFKHLHKDKKAEVPPWCQIYPLTSTIQGYRVRYLRKFGLRWLGYTWTLDILHDKNSWGC